MLYFAYGSNLNVRAVTEWCRHYGHRSPAIRNGRPATLQNYRLGFPIFSEYWGGGIADIMYDPGKYVSGVLFELSDVDMKTMDTKVGRQLDSGGKEIGVYHRIEVDVAPQGERTPQKAVTYAGPPGQKMHIPPTLNYMDLVIQGAYQHGLTMMWISYLQSFSTQDARTPKPPEPTGTYRL